MTECPAGYSLGSLPLNYTVGNAVKPAYVPTCLPCRPPCLTCSALSPRACLSCPTHRHLDPATGTCTHLNQFERETPGSFMVGPSREGAPALGSHLPTTVAVLSCVAIVVTFVSVFLMLQLRSGALLLLPALEAGASGGGVGGIEGLRGRLGLGGGGRRVASYHGIPTVWGDDDLNTDSDTEEFGVHNERTAFIKTQSAL